MAQQDNQEIIRKIKRCMDLSNSANEHESALALKQMKALMNKYNLTEKHALASDVNQAIFQLTIKERVPQWIYDLHSVIGQALDCESIVTRGGGKNARLCFVGVDASPEIANYAFEVMFRKIKADRANFIKDKVQGLSRGNKVKLADAYCKGWIINVYSKVENLNPNKEIQEKIKAYNETSADGWNENAISGIDRNKTKTKASEQALSMGYHDSTEINLYVATENKSQTLIGENNGTI
jgi:hypothetical protein